MQQYEMCCGLSHQNNEDNRKKIIAFCDEYICKTKVILSFGEKARTMLRSRGEPEDSAQKFYDALVELKAIIEKSDNVKEDVEKIAIAQFFVEE